MQQWHVLIVEDEIDGQEVVREILNYFNISTDAVGTAEDALHFLGESTYTAAIIDLGLPGMNGIELLSAIRQIPTTQHIPCIAITAYHSSQLKHEVLEAGFDAYFPKPLDDTGFMRQLDHIISNH
jgi:CheY-like chemotaxis protein